MIKMENVEMAIKTFILEYKPDKEERHAEISAAVKEYLGNEAEIKYSEKGKPFITGISGEKFISVTTSGKLTVFVISDAPVGLDGEFLGRFTPENKTDYIALAERFFAEEEAEYVRDGDGDPMRFVKVWIRKEAYVKLTGKGLADFPNFSVCDGERFYAKVNGVPIRKFVINTPDNNDFLFALAGAE